jgi:hypothetical protein
MTLIVNSLYFNYTYVLHFSKEANRNTCVVDASPVGEQRRRNKQSDRVQRKDKLQRQNACVPAIKPHALTRSKAAAMGHPRYHLCWKGHWHHPPGLQRVPP